MEHIDRSRCVAEAEMSLSLVDVTTRELATPCHVRDLKSFTLIGTCWQISTFTQVP